MGTQQLDLPVVPVADEVAIALFITTDVGLSVIDRAGSELAALLRPSRPEAVVTAATLGIPLGMSVAAALGLDRVVVLHKTNKIHLADALTEAVSSITTDGSQVLRLDRAMVPEVHDRRVAFVDDVISTGSSAAAGLRLIRQAGGEVVAIGTAFVEGTEWATTLGDDGERVDHLGRLPIFGPDDGGWTPIDEL